MRKLLVAAIVTMLAGAGANAELLTNGDLDDQSQVGAYIGLAHGHDLGALDRTTLTDHDAYASIMGWTGLGTGIEMQAFREDHPAGAANSGSLHAELDVGNYNDQDTDPSLWGTNQHGGMSQTFTVSQAGDHRLTFYYRARPDYPSFTAEQQGFIGDPNPADDLSTFAIGVYLNGSRVGAVDIGSSGSADGDLVKKSLGDFAWEMFAFDFNLGVGQHTLAFMALGLADSYGGLLDTIGLQLIPEPGTYVLLGAGLIGIYFLRRRQRRI